MTDTASSGMLDTYEHLVKEYKGMMRSALLAVSLDTDRVRWENARGVFLSSSEAALTKPGGMLLIDFVVLLRTSDIQMIVLYKERWPQTDAFEIGYAVIQDDGATATGEVETVDQLFEVAIPDTMPFAERPHQLQMFMEITTKLRELGLIP